MAEHDAAAARAFWSGTVSFGLVSIPVHVLPAVRSEGVALRMLGPGGSPLRRRYVCPAEGRPVEWDELVRGYEVSPGTYVVLSDEELDSLAPEKTRDIDLRRFVDVEALDPVFFERAYFLTPSGNSNKAYRLLAETMEATGQAGIATFVMRSKEYLVAIVAEGGILRAETLRFAGEVRAPSDVGLPDAPEPSAAAVRRMEEAIAELTGSELEESELRDEDAERLRAVAEAKRRRGEDVVRPPAESDDDASAGGDIIDLMEVLRRSLAGDDGPDASRRPARRRKTPKRAAAKQAVGTPDLANLTRDELYARARELDVPGRSSMTKADLVRALRGA